MRGFRVERVKNTKVFLESIKSAPKQPLRPGLFDPFSLDPARPYWARPVNQPIERKEEPMKYIVDAKEIKKHQSIAKQNIKQICEDLASNPSEYARFNENLSD